MKPNTGTFVVLVLAFTAASSTATARTAASTMATPVADSTAAAGSPVAPPVTAIPARHETVVAFEDALPASSYRLQRVRIWVDGALRYDGPPPMGVPLARGDHLVAVAADYRMSDPVFSYVRGYHIEVRASRHVPGSGDGRVVVARAIESGGVTTPFDHRARIVWR